MGRMGVGTRKDDSAIIRWQLPVMARNSGPHGDHAISEDTVLRIHRDNGSILDQGVKLIACFSACGCSANRK